MRRARDWRALARGPEDLAVEVVAGHVKRLFERFVAPAERSFFYLVEGRERDCLIDGGWGLCASIDALRADPAKPLAAIATHSHFDHIGMLHLCGLRYGHAAEAAVFACPDPRATQALPYLEGRIALADGGTVEPRSFRQRPCPLDAAVGDGDRVDLGGLSLRILHTPGHSPGSLSVLDADAGLLFCADTVHDGHIHDDIPGANRSALLLSHQRLAEVDFAEALPGHGAVLDRSAFLCRIERYRREHER